MISLSKLRIDHPSWLPYIAPMAAFAIAGFAESSVHVAYPIAYAVKIVVVCVVAWLCRGTWKDFIPLPSSSAFAAGVGLGVLVSIFWVAIDPYYPPLPGGKRVAFDPNSLAPSQRMLFLTFRLFGFIGVVPLIEELIWRSFVMRWVVDSNFERVPVGVVTPMAAFVSSGLFALAHPEWLAALVTGLIWSGLLATTRSLAACVVSHAAANLTLAIYILATGSWRFW